MVLGVKILLCCLISAHLSYGVPVDFDYYFSALRSGISCGSVADKVDCQIKCGMKTGMCLEEQCYCLTVSSLKQYGINDSKHILPKILNHSSEDHQTYKDFNNNSEEPEPKDNRSADSSQDTPEYLDKSLLSDNKPLLRHHIAHFCPNLDVARTCIRTCMKVGKPAFCGKDHVCYCGHKYSEHDKAEVDEKSSYSDFRDMYEKYFGPKYKQVLNV